MPVRGDHLFKPLWVVLLTALLLRTLHVAGGVLVQQGREPSFEAVDAAVVATRAVVAIKFDHFIVWFVFPANTALLGHFKNI